MAVTISYIIHFSQNIVQRWSPGFEFLLCPELIRQDALIQPHFCKMGRTRILSYLTRGAFKWGPNVAASRWQQETVLEQDVWLGPLCSFTSILFYLSSLHKRDSNPAGPPPPPPNPPFPSLSPSSLSHAGVKRGEMERTALSPLSNKIIWLQTWAEPF